MEMNEQTVPSSRIGEHSVCPWWLAYFFDNPLRRMIHPADRVLGPYVTDGMSVLDFGCGFGHYSLGMARMTGASGRVFAADVQKKMLKKTMARARKAGLDGIIQPLLCKSDGICTTMELDFVLACNSLHETPDPARTLAELFTLIRPGGKFLLMEPSAHLKASDFENEVDLAVKAGFEELRRPVVTRQFCAFFQRPGSRVKT